MNLNKQQKALLDNVTNILSALVAVNIPKETLAEQMAKQIAEFEAKVPDCRLRLRLGAAPHIEVFDCSRDSAKTSRDASKYLTLRARIMDTRLTAIVGSRDSVTSNAVISEALRELADIVDKMPFELSEKESVDLMEELGIKHLSGGQDDDQDAGTTAAAEIVEATVEAAPAPAAVTPVVDEAPAALAPAAVTEVAPAVSAVSAVAPVAAAVADDSDADAEMIASKLQVIHEAPVAVVEAQVQAPAVIEPQEDAPLIALVRVNVDEDGIELV